MGLCTTLDFVILSRGKPKEPAVRPNSHKPGCPRFAKLTWVFGDVRTDNATTRANYQSSLPITPATASKMTSRYLQGIADTRA